MESSKNNPILKFRLDDPAGVTEPVEELNLVSGLNRNGDQHLQNLPGGSFITLTREATDSTESSG